MAAANGGGGHDPFKPAACIKLAARSYPLPKDCQSRAAKRQQEQRGFRPHRAASCEALRMVRGGLFVQMTGANAPPLASLTTALGAVRRRAEMALVGGEDASKLLL